MSNTGRGPSLELAYQVVAGVLDPELDADDVQPFTAFGQLGPDMLDLRCILQTTAWVDRLGHPHRLEDMTPDYRAAVMEFLAGNQSRWVVQALVTTIATYLLGAISPEEAANRINSIHLLGDGWILHTPHSPVDCANSTTKQTRHTLRTPSSPAQQPGLRSPQATS